MGEDMTDTAAETAPASAPHVSTPDIPSISNPAGQKLPGWQKRLTDFLRANHARPFQPGRWDCAIWAAGAVEAMTGEDHLRGFRDTAPSRKVGANSRRAASRTM